MKVLGAAVFEMQKHLPKSLDRLFMLFSINLSKGNFNVGDIWNFHDKPPGDLSRVL